MDKPLTREEWNNDPEWSEKTDDMSEEQKDAVYEDYCIIHNYWASLDDDEEEYHIHNDITCN